MEETIKNTLVAERNRSYDCYKDSGVEWLGKIPEHWDLTRLGTRFKERRTKVSDKDYPALSVTKNGTVPQLANAAKTNDGDNRKLVKKGDFVINSRSDRKGSSGIAYQDGSVSLINIVMEPLNIHSIYCNYLLKSYNFIEEFYRMGHGIVADLWTTRYDEMKIIMVGIPPLPEQTAIANFLDDKTAKIDQAIGIKEQQIALLKERKQILIHKAVTRGLDDSVPLKDSGVDWIGKIPEHWEVKRLKHVCKIESGLIDPKKSQYKNMVLIAPNHIESGSGIILHLETAEEQNAESGKYIVEEGDLIYSKIRPELRKVCIALGKSLCSADMYPIKPSNILDVKFLLLIFLGEKFNDFMTNQSMRVAMPKVNRDDVMNYYLAIPDFHEQKEISAYIETASQKIDTAVTIKQQEIEKLKEYKSSLINSVVTGKVKVC